MRKAALWIAALTFGAAGLFYAPNFTIDIPETRVHDEIAARLPVTVQKDGINVLVRSAEVDFLDSNAVHVVTDADIAGIGLSGSVRADVTSSLTYRDGAFYLADLSMEDIDIKIDQDSSEKISDVGSIAESLYNGLRGRLEAGNPGAGDALDNLRSKAEEKMQPVIRDTINNILADIPVYDLNGKDLKHNLAALALEDVSFSADAAHVTLDPGSLIIRIILLTLAFIVAALGSLGATMGILGTGRQ